MKRTKTLSLDRDRLLFWGGVEAFTLFITWYLFDTNMLKPFLTSHIFIIIIILLTIVHDYLKTFYNKEMDKEKLKVCLAFMDSKERLDEVDKYLIDLEKFVKSKYKHLCLFSSSRNNVPDILFEHNYPSKRLVELYLKHGGFIITSLKVLGFIDREVYHDFLNVINYMEIYNNKLLSDLNNINDIRNSVINCRSDSKFKELDNDILSTYDYTLKAKKIRNSINGLNEDLSSKYLLDNLFNNWLLMASLYMVDNEYILNSKLKISLDKIEEILNKEQNKEDSIINNLKAEEKNKKDKLWEEQSDKFLDKITSINEDFK